MKITTSKVVFLCFLFLYIYIYIYIYCFNQGIVICVLLSTNINYLFFLFAFTIYFFKCFFKQKLHRIFFFAKKQTNYYFELLFCCLSPLQLCHRLVTRRFCIYIFFIIRISSSFFIRPKGMFFYLFFCFHFVGFTSSFICRCLV